MLKKWIGLLTVACLLAVLAACGNGDAEKDNGQKESAAKQDKVTEESAGETADTDQPEEDGGEGEEAPSGTATPDTGMTDMQIGLTAEEFQRNFNHFAEEEGIEERIDQLEWKPSGSGGDHQIVDVQFDEDRRLQLLAKGGDENIRAVMFSSFKDREKAVQLVRVLIRTAEPSASAEETDRWMEDLKFNGSAEGLEEYRFAETGAYNLMTEDDGSYLAFVLSNKNDPEITKEAFESGDL